MARPSSDADGDERDADELVLAPADGLAQLVGGRLAAASVVGAVSLETSRAGRWRRGSPAGVGRRPGRRRRRGAADRGRCDVVAFGRLLRRWSPGGHDRVQRYQGGVSADPAIPLISGLSAVGRRPTARRRRRRRTTSRLPPCVDSTRDGVLHGAARSPPSIDEQLDVGLAAARSSDLVEHRRRVEVGRRRGERVAAGRRPARRLGDELAVDVHVRRAPSSRRRRRRTG